MSERVDLRRVRLNDFTAAEWEDALAGTYGQVGSSQYALILIKNVLFVNLYSGASVDLLLPTVHDGFILTSKKRIIEVKNSTLTCELESGETAAGHLILEKWN